MPGENKYINVDKCKCSVTPEITQCCTGIQYGMHYPHPPLEPHYPAVNLKEIAPSVDILDLKALIFCVICSLVHMFLQKK